MYYTAINAHELCVGDTVYVADNLQDLEEQIRKGSYPVKIEGILKENASARFVAKKLNWNLAYLVARKEKEVFRPFKDLNELIEHAPKGIPGYLDTQIWIKHKDSGYRELYVITFGGEIEQRSFISFQDLLENYVFMNGDIIGVKK